MSIELYVHTSGVGPGDAPSCSWDYFSKYAPPFSVALDGYVHEGPNFDSTKVIVNFNHHEGVDRLATRATCAQVLMAIRQGMFSKFRDFNGAQAKVYVNDCDEDVCTSWFLLNNYHLVEGTMNPLINRLVSMEDALDSTAGAYPFPVDLPALKEMAWIFEPYRQFRMSGALEKREYEAYKSIITDVENRILQHVTGHGKSAIMLDTRYELIGGGNGWSMVKEVGPYARTAMFSEGIKAYVSVRERSDGRYTYTIGKLSPFIPFDLINITATLNREDDIIGDDKWGGGNNIMGSPRSRGSSIKPEKLSEIIKESK
jgi:hypothetical protein